jgi:hypothetical protein
MVNKREKGKIPHSEWPKILARYSKGETIAQIGRDYGCTAPAIRYIIKRNGMLRDETSGGAVGDHASAGKLFAAEAREPDAEAQAATARPMVVPSERPARDTLLTPELRRRVSSDVAAFLVALDHVVLEGSTESLAGLQEATDQLMRSAARTRLEVERLLSRYETRVRENARRKVDTPRRSA